MKQDTYLISKIYKDKYTKFEYKKYAHITISIDEKVT